MMHDQKNIKLLVQ